MGRASCDFRPKSPVTTVDAAFLGIWGHVHANYEAAPLDVRYADTWDGLPEVTRWWLAATKTVGPSPPLASGALAQAALCVLLATLRHPALRRDRPSVARTLEGRSA